MTGIAASGPMSPRPEHGGPVADDRDRVALDRELEGLLAVLGDRLADARHAGRVGHREVVAGLDRDLVVLLDLAADVHEERAVGGVDEAGARRADRVEDPVPVGLVGGVDGEVADGAVLLGGDEVDRADHARRRG
jgi:hypothetical protein